VAPSVPPARETAASSTKPAWKPRTKSWPAGITGSGGCGGQGS